MRFGGQALLQEKSALWAWDLLCSLSWNSYSSLNLCCVSEVWWDDETCSKLWTANVPTIPCHSVCTEHARCPGGRGLVAEPRWARRAWEASEAPGVGGVRCPCLSPGGAPVPAGPGLPGDQNLLQLQKEGKGISPTASPTNKPITSLLIPVTSLE